MFKYKHFKVKMTENNTNINSAIRSCIEADEKFKVENESFSNLLIYFK